MKVSILIPCYNERGTIGELIRRAAKADLGSWNREIIVVDDGSTDGSREIINLFRTAPRTTVIFHEKNKGKGGALVTALSQATGDYVVVQDADLELMPEEIVLLLAKAEKGAAAVYGTRNVGGINPHPHKLAAAGVWVLTKLMNILYGTRLTDVWNGFKLIRRDLLVDTPFMSGGFESEILFTASLAHRGIRIEEVPVTYIPRTAGQKKITYTDGVRTLLLLLSHRLRTLPVIGRCVPQDRAEQLVFFGTLAATLLFLCISVAVNGSAFRATMLQLDDYLILAKNIYEHGIYSESITAPFQPASVRTPLYPLIIGIPWLIAGKNWIGAYLGQQLLNAFLSLIFFRFVRRLVPGNSIPVLATAIFALEPVRLYTAMTLQSEIALLILLIGGLFCIQRFMETRAGSHLLWAALLWGFTPMLRPVTQLGILAFPVLVFAVLHRREALRRKFLLALTAVVIFVLPEIPWLMRNYAVFGQAKLSSLPEHQLTSVVVPYFMAWKEPCTHCDREQAIAFWRDRITSLVVSGSPTGFREREHVGLADAPAVRAAVLPFITSDLGGFARFLIPQAIMYPFVDSWRSVLHDVFGVAPRAQFPISFPARLAEGDLGVIREAYRLGRDPTFIVFLLGKAVAAALVVFSIIGFAVLWRARTVHRAMLILLVALFGFFAALAVPTYELRYRTYLLPFLALWAAVGIVRLWKRDVISQ